MNTATVRIPLPIASSASLMAVGVNELKLLLAMSSEREAGYTHGEATVPTVSYVTGIKRQNVAKAAASLNAGFAFRFEDGEFSAVDAASVTGDYGSRVVRVDFSRAWESRAVGECVEIAVDEFRRYRNKASLLLRLRVGAMTLHTKHAVSKTYRPSELHGLVGAEVKSAAHVLESLIQPAVDELRHLSPLFEVSLHAIRPEGRGRRLHAVQLKVHHLVGAASIYPIMSETPPPPWVAAPGRVPPAKRLNPRPVSTYDRRPRNALRHIIQPEPVADPIAEQEYADSVAAELQEQSTLHKPTRAECMALEAAGNRWGATKLCLDYARYPVSPKCEPLPLVESHADLSPSIIDQTRRNVLDARAQSRWYDTMVECGLLASFRNDDEDEEPCLDADY